MFSRMNCEDLYSKYQQRNEMIGTDITTNTNYIKTVGMIDLRNKR